MTKRIQNSIIYAFLAYLVIGIISSLIITDSQVVSVQWGKLLSDLPGSLGEIVGIIIVRGIIPVLFWPFRLI